MVFHSWERYLHQNTSGLYIQIKYNKLHRLSIISPIFLDCVFCMPKRRKLLLRCNNNPKRSNSSSFFRNTSNQFILKAFRSIFYYVDNFKWNIEVYYIWKTYTHIVDQVLEGIRSFWRTYLNEWIFWIRMYV